MAAKKDLWQTVSLKPLTGVLDLRSRPADIAAGGFRWRQNWGTSDENKLCRREGHSRLFPPALNGTYANSDHHFQNATREPITLIYENTNPDGSRNLFDGTSSRVSLLDETSGLWTDIITGLGANGSQWKAASLQGFVLFTNNVNPVQAYSIGGASLVGIPDLITLNVTAAAVIVEFNGVIFLMNVFQNGSRQSSRVRWSDLNNPVSNAGGINSWVPGTGSLAGFQDLDYGEQILAAKAMLGALLIYTTRAIWQCTVNPNATPTTAPFLFQKIYSEPKNQIGCLAYPNTLVSTGLDHYYMSKDGIYHFSPYLAEPERIDWIHKADAIIFTNPLTKLDPNLCTSPVAESLPIAKEIWFSWALPGFPFNNSWTLVLNIEQKAADIVDHGYTALANYHPNPSTSQLCSQTQVFIGASGIDWGLKQIGGVLSREMLTLTNGHITEDIPLNAPIYVITGYYSQLRGMIPLGAVDRDKLIRRVIVDDDVSEQTVPCAWRLRIGHSYKLNDPNDTDPVCTPIWRQLEDRPMQCPDVDTVPDMTAKNLTPDINTEWPMLERGNFLYFELTVANKDGSPAIGGDVCLSRIDFDVSAMPQRPG